MRLNGVYIIKSSFSLNYAMRNITIHTLTAVIAILLLSSCKSKQNIAYFNNLPEAESGVIGTSEYGLRIEPADELVITVNSLEPKASADYNLPLTNPATASDIKETTTPRQQSYVVNHDGNITLPVIGQMHVSGMTIDQLTDSITHMVGKYVADPIVRVALTNFKVSVVGEVANPRTITSSSERLSIFDALAQAGDITEYGVKESVIVMREQNGEKTYQRLNLHDASIVNSPFYYLKQNDVIIVAPNDIKQANSKYNQHNAYKLSVTSTIVSALSVVTTLIIALTVK